MSNVTDGLRSLLIGYDELYLTSAGNRLMWSSNDVDNHMKDDSHAIQLRWWGNADPAADRHLEAMVVRTTGERGQKDTNAFDSRTSTGAGEWDRATKLLLNGTKETSKNFSASKCSFPSLVAKKSELDTSDTEQDTVMMNKSLSRWSCKVILLSQISFVG